MSYKQRTTFPTASLVLIVFFLITSVKPALAPGADAAIKAAIEAAIQDGFNTIDAGLRLTYWYYLQGSNMTTYKVIMKPDSINYIIIYENKGSLFQVNCDLIKQTWQPRLNNFVKLASGAPANVVIQAIAPITTNTSIELTNQTKFNEIAKTIEPQGVPPPQNEQIILPNPLPNLLSQPQGN